jgi:NAD(P)-dependent dehydrogenase (short-subunit alcohol dehydrogenase family)
MEQVILITGASSGIGKAIAGLLASKGYRVYGTSRKPDQEEKGYSLIPMDITDEVSVTRAIGTVIDKEGRMDVLINNVGMGIGGAIESFTREEADRQMDVNFSGMTRVTREVLPHMRQQRSGKIINISSIGGLIGLPFQSFYSASKFAIEGYSEALAMEVRPWNIRVVVVNPGDFKTGFTASRQVTKKDQSGSDYQSAANKAIGIMGRDEQSGCDPQLLAKTIDKIVRKKYPKYRYIVGRFDQRLIARIRHLLPPGLVRRIISSHYGI